jgi:hypothetical protein
LCTVAFGTLQQSLLRSIVASANKAIATLVDKVFTQYLLPCKHERVDDTNSEECVQAILEDVDDQLNTRTLEVLGDIEDVKCGHDEEDAYVSTRNQVEFFSFEQFNSNLLKIDDRLICRPIEVKGRDHYANLRNAFEDYQKKHKQILLNSRRKKVKKNASSDIT